MFCVICGTENPDFARFCRKCGNPVPDEFEESRRPVQEQTQTIAEEPDRSGLSSPLPSGVVNQLKIEEFAENYRHRTTDELLQVKQGDLFPEARIALEAELRARPEALLSNTTIERGLPYRWGKFQGWVLLVVGSFAAVALILLFLGFPLDENSKGYAIVSPLMIASGYAFVRRKKHAPVMPYVWMGIFVLDFLISALGAATDKSLTPEQQGHQMGTGIGKALFGFIFWGLCAIYYHKRRSEFAAENPSKSTRRP